MRSGLIKASWQPVRNSRSLRAAMGVGTDFLLVRPADKMYTLVKRVSRDMTDFRAPLCGS